MARYAALAAVFIGTAANMEEYIAVPGGFACPRDCAAATTSEECAEGGKALGLPCGSTKAVAVTRTSTNGDYAGLVNALGVPSFRGSVIVSGGTDASLVGTELVALSYVTGSQLQQIDFSNRTDSVTAEISSGWAAAPVGLTVTLTFKGACSVTEQTAKAEMGGCSWRKGAGLYFNSYTEAGRADIYPWEQVPDGKVLIAAEGADAFRICKCTQLPQFVAVMHSKCAPSCRRSYDPCSQHAGCKKIDTWEKCKAAGTALNWVPLKGNDASQAGSGAQTLAAWNAQFTPSMWLQNRGTTTPTATTPALCTGAGSATCLRNPIWQQGGSLSEWTTAGLTGGKDRWYEYINDTVTTFPADAIANLLWKDFKTGAENMLPPPPVNFLGDAAVGVIPAQTQWSPMWSAPQGYLDDGWSQSLASLRPGGCTFKHDLMSYPTQVFFPWHTLRLRDESNDKTSQACCPPGTTFGTDCFVENCTAQPCLEWGAGEKCNNQVSETEDTFAMCECSNSNNVAAHDDECIYYGQPCGAGQTCTDPDLNSFDGQWQCTCIGDAGVSATGQPATCPDDNLIKYLAKPAGRGCGECNRVASLAQCEAAATQLGLSDTSATFDSIFQARTRPCGCHYSEHGEICTGSSGECLRFNSVYGDAVYSGCDAYEPADAHDFLICACYDSMPKYVAAPVVSCPATCDPIVSKEDCRKGAEYIGMHLAVHEEQEAMLLLEGSQALSKQPPHHTYVGLDGQTYQHRDNGLGDVVGDGPLAQAFRPPGCHYRRRFDADVLPDGSTVNWPHLLFNPKVDSTVAASTQDMLICRCPDAFPLAQTPAPTATNAAYAAQVGLAQQLSGGQEGSCQLTDGYIQLGSAYRATFQTCANICMAASGCEGMSWFLDPNRSYDTEGMGVCTHLACSTSPTPCPAITVLPGAGQECYAKGTPTPAATPVPTTQGPPCNSYCCMQSDRATCCAGLANPYGTDCEWGTSTAYCVWTRPNNCERNGYDRGGQCAEIEILFNATAWLGLVAPPSDTDLSMMQGQVAVEANQLIGSTVESVVPANSSVWYDLPTGQLKVWLMCTDGGCGSFDEIAQSLCPAGTQVMSGSPAMWSGADLNGQVTCLKRPTGGFTEQFPTDALAGMQPTQVQVRKCGCAPELEPVDVSANVPLNFVEKKVTSSEIAPAFTNAPAIDGLCKVPDYLQGMTHFRMQHRVPEGTTFTFHCPAGCGVCDVFLFHYHETPCSSASNGRFPALMPADGWQPGGCSPKLCNDTMRWGSVGYRKQVMANTTVTTPPVESSCLSYFGLFAGPGVFCEDNGLQDEALCNSAGGLCKWTDGECVSEWCPHTIGSGTPHVCQQIPDAECPAPQSTSPPAP